MKVSTVKGSSKINILVFGFINMNVMDGSAVFIQSLVTMLSRNKNINIDLVLANPVRRDLLLQPLYAIENINIISPYADPDLSPKEYTWKTKNRMSYSEASHMINHYWNKKKYDWFIIRGIEVSIKLVDVNPNIIRNSMVYMTGLTHSNQEITEQKKNEFKSLKNLEAYILCQTKEMKNFILEKLGKEYEKNIIPLNPMVPDTSDDFYEVFEPKSNYYRLCYTGKFDKGWNSIPMVVGFRELLEEIPSATLEVAGDKFNNNHDNPNYVRDLKYLLSSTKNLTWYGAVTRDEAQQIIRRSDIGVTWRDESMDSSLELSTKLLEYGTLGKAVILNPTDMHKSIFGEDYPLYAVTFEDFMEKSKLAMENPEIYEFAARRMFERSKQFTFTEILNNLLPYLIESKVTSIIESILETNDNELIQKIVNSVQTTGEFLHQTNDNKTLLVKNIKNMFNYFDVLESVSNIGIISDYDQIGNMVFFFIDNKDDDFYHNYYHNMNMEVLSKINANNNIPNHNAHMPKNLLESTQSSPEADNKRYMQLNKKYMLLESKYNALSNSKFGKIQLKYWKLKRK